MGLSGREGGRGTYRPCGRGVCVGWGRGKGEEWVEGSGGRSVFLETGKGWMDGGGGGWRMDGWMDTEMWTGNAGGGGMCDDPVPRAHTTVQLVHCELSKPRRPVSHVSGMEEGGVCLQYAPSRLAPRTIRCDMMQQSSFPAAQFPKPAPDRRTSAHTCTSVCFRYSSAPPSNIRHPSVSAHPILQRPPVTLPPLLPQILFSSPAAHTFHLN